MNNSHSRLHGYTNLSRRLLVLLSARGLREDGDAVLGGICVRGQGFGDGLRGDAASAENGQRLRLRESEWSIGR